MLYEERPLPLHARKHANARTQLGAGRVGGKGGGSHFRSNTAANWPTSNWPNFNSVTETFTYAQIRFTLKSAEKVSVCNLPQQPLELPNKPLSPTLPKKQLQEIEPVYRPRSYRAKERANIETTLT